jgi:hypothetical protein
MQNKHTAQSNLIEAVSELLQRVDNTPSAGICLLIVPNQNLFTPLNVEFSSLRAVSMSIRHFRAVFLECALERNRDQGALACKTKDIGISLTIGQP